MRKLTLSILAAGIALSAGPALAQQHGGGRAGGGGHWRGGGGGHVGMPARGPNMQMRHGGGFVGRPVHGPNVRWRHGGGFRHPGPNFRHGRMQRGFVIHPFWFGGQFQINNWQVYGFADPGPDRRWVRYYDDAYLIDGDGRVVDYRYDLDWDRYGEDWEVEDGVPAYRGRDMAEDDGDGDGDGDDDDDGGDHHGRGGHHGGGHHGGGQMQGGYGYGGYYGYGFYAYPIVIETVTTGATVYEEVIEEVVEVRRRPVRRARCHCPRPAPRPAPPRRPPPGERG
jgi:Ni/Co efflux regulator RcnB